MTTNQHGSPDEIPVPSDGNGGLARAYLVGGGRTPEGKSLWRVAWGLDGGRRMDPFTEPLPHRQAHALCQRLNARVDR